MKNLLLFCSLFFTLAVFSQNLPIGHTTIMFEDPDRGNRQIETEIYYPATVAGEDTPGATGEYPVIVFGHGFVMAWSAYENLWEEFVPRGYIMAFPRTEGNALSTDHQRFGFDLQFLVTAMQQEGNDPASVLHEIVASETALMGHSMGGGAAFLAADSLVTNGNTNLKTLVGLAPAESSSNGVSSIASATQITLPSLILSGEQDGVTPPAEHHIPMYDSLASTCKTIIHIIGGAHCYFANSNFNCDFGESTSSTGISISRQEQHEVTFDFVNLWLDYTLKTDCNDFTTFNDSLAVSPRINFDQECNGPITFESSETAKICQGDTYTFPDGTTSTTATTHTSTLSSVGGCDSIVETTLSVIPTVTTSEDVSICQGNTFTFPDGTTSSSATTHTSALTSITGCDSLVETTLQVMNVYSLTETASICQGGTYTFPDGTTSSTATIHTSSFNSVNGCDSIIETTLEINDSFNLSETATICQGETYTFPDGTTGSSATTYTSNLTSVDGCDSIIETSLQVTTSYNLTETASICQGNTYTFPDGTTSSTATTHTSYLTSAGGCDSIVETTLQVTNSYNLSEIATICQGDTYTFPDGTTGSSATTYISNLASIHGCDSIIETTLQVTNSYNLTETATICQGDTYTFPDGTTGSTATTHSSNLMSIDGCDSIIETTLQVTNSYNLTETATICQGDTYTFPDGTTGSTSTTHTSTLSSTNGCDSIIETTLQVNTPYNLSETATICQGDTYTFPDGTTGSTATTHISNLTALNGCDSIIETTLVVTTTINITENASVCQGDTYTFPDGTTSSTATTHTSHLTSVGGCDSIVETILDVTTPVNTTENASICQGSTYTFPDGTTSSTATTHTSLLTSQSGCDSIVETTLNIVNSFNITESASICQSGTFTFPDGTTSSTATTHTSTLTSVGGCDSIIETTLQVTDSYSLAESATICQGETYTFPDGTTDSTAITHTSNLTTVHGCDSIIETTLNVVNSYYLTETVSICQGDTYTFPDGTTSSSATTHTSTFTTSDGCDSIIATTLNVTIIDTNITSSTFNLSANESGATYQWIDCEDNTSIVGETNETFEPQETGDYAVEITLDGCTSVSNCHTFQVASLDKETKNIFFNLYPNPSNGSFIIESSSNYNLEIFDATGGIVHDSKITVGENKINISINPGVYFWKALDGQSEMQTGKLIIR